MEGIFDLVLEKDEKVIETFKPNKFKTYFKAIFNFTWILILALAPLAIGLFVPEEGMDPAKPIWSLVPIGAFVLGEILFVLFLNMYYKKTFYAYTNKRVLIRTGIVGVDYKSLDLKSVGAMDVYVSLLDKMLGKNTGTLRFGSMSSPMNSGVSSYQFAHIQNPYEIYKKIKEFKGSIEN